MAVDHPDDTILDDELDENDFNFDNENEDALLAETEFDFVEKPEPSQSMDTDHPEAEEDVLDIGIAEEDIVDAEPIGLPSAIPEVNQIQITESTTHDALTHIDQVESESEKEELLAVKRRENSLTISDEQTNKLEFDESNLKSDVNEQDTVSSSVDEIEIQHSGASKNDEIVLAKSSRSKVISLKKSAGRNYDNLPALSKVIEQAHPSSSASSSSSASFRNRKFVGREQENNIRNRKRVEPSSKRRHEPDKINRSERRRFASEDSSAYYNDESSHHRVEEYGNNSKRFSDADESFRSEYNNEYDDYAVDSGLSKKIFDERKFESSTTGFAQQSIVASVQITQKRYQITSDFTVPVSGGSFNAPYCDLSANTTMSLPPSSSIQPIGPPQPLLPPPQQRHSLPIDSNAFVRPPPNIACGIRAPLMTPFTRPMQSMPPHPPNQLPASTMNRLPIGSGVPFPNQAAPFPAPHFQSSPANCVPNMRPQMLPAPQLNRNIRPPPTHSVFRPLGPPHMRPDSMRLQGPPTNFAPPPMMMSRGPPQPPPFRPCGPPQMPHHAPSMAPMCPPYPNSDPRMPPPQPPNHFRPNPPPPSHLLHPPVVPSSHSVNSSVAPPSTVPSSVYQQPPPPGVMMNQPLARQPVFKPLVHEVNYPRYEMQPSGQHQQYYSNSTQSVCKAPDNFIGQDVRVSNLKRINAESMNDIPFKQKRYDYSPAKKANKVRNLHEVKTIDTLPDTIGALTETSEAEAVVQEDEDLASYRKKVEHQKKLRDKFVQMKEEQRLKNQMQSFIQNNIKGILEKREQFLRKSEADQQAKSESNSRTTNTTRSSGSGGTVRIEESTRRRADERPPRRVESKPRTLPLKRDTSYETSGKDLSLQTTTKIDCSDQRQLHKVLKIKYKDGTVAFKSIPVHCAAANISKNETKISNFDGAKAMLLEEDDNGRHVTTSGVTQRRMVVSTHISAPNVRSDSATESAIVESIRKGVTQSSVPLAQRFANLRATNKQSNTRPL